MPLNTFTGPAMDPLMARVQNELGEQAVIVQVRQRKSRAGGNEYQVIAGDPGSVLEAQEAVGGPGPAEGTGAMSPLRGLGLRRAGRGPLVIALVGPTGVGKTTTLAKLASHPKVFGGRRVGLIGLDTYRIGALEQLRTYAELLRAPVEILYDATDILGALRRLSNCEVLLVDTPGRGPRLKQDSEAVYRVLRRLTPSETHLVLPVGQQPELVRRTIDRYLPLGVTHLLATKVDELPDDWILFDQAAERNLPMRWVADGQEVPRDLRSAAPRLLAAVATVRARRGERPVGQGVA